MSFEKLEKDINELLQSALKIFFQKNPSYEKISQKIPVFDLEIPKEKKFGDLSTNLALKLSKELKLQPFDIAKSMEDVLNCLLKDSKLKINIKHFEAVRPGFINIFLAENFLYTALKDIINLKDKFGRIDIGKRKSFNIEFVSANPTGPLTVAHGRQAAVGDTLARILEFVNYKVTREYYSNDEGNQINILGKSIMARSQEITGKKSEFPEDGYRGEYIYGIARKINEEYKERAKKEPYEFFAEVGYKIILDGIVKDLEDFGVRFDVWYSQRKLRVSGKIEETIKILKKKGYIYESDGATWFKSTLFGDDKDRVVVKSDGSFTYLAPDIAYHLDKYKRSFDMLVDIWGPDHHGYIPRIAAAVEALGYDRTTLKVIIVQLATLYREGNALSMSTRAGEFITLREVMDEVGRDAARFFFIMRKTDSHLDFDMELAKKQSPDNPVYYIQYAHARICSILNFKEEKKLKLDPKKASLDLLKSGEEIALASVLVRFPISIRFAASELEPYSIVNYLIELATVFHSFYTRHRVVTDDAPLTEARLILCECVKIVLKNGLNLLGISVPEKM